MSDGLILPFIACIVASLFFGSQPAMLFLVGVFVAVAGALAFGLARYFGEQEEIHHNHPDLAAQDAEKERARMRHIGIDAALSDDIDAQMNRERQQWLAEVAENDLGWEQVSKSRAAWSSLAVAAGFFLGGLLVTLPFYAVRYEHVDLIFPAGCFLLLMVGFGSIKAAVLKASMSKVVLNKLVTAIVVIGAVGLIYLFLSAFSS